MNSNSILLVALATVVGAIALYFAVFFGMNASDDFASRLSMNSTDYIREREDAMLEGKDPLSISIPAARSHQPSDYDRSLSATETSPYVRPDSDESEPNSDDSSGELIGAEEIATNENSAETQSELTPDESEEREDEKNTDDEDNENAAEPDGENAVHAAIRRRLATEEMSDEKRAALESVLPQPSAKSVRAIDVRLQFDPASCVVPRNSNSWIGVMFRRNSATIRGASLTDLDTIVQLHDRCAGNLIIEHHALAVRSADIELREDRRNEVKYYLLQRHVPKEAIQVIEPQ